VDIKQSIEILVECLIRVLILICVCSISSLLLWLFDDNLLTYFQEKRKELQNKIAIHTPKDQGKRPKSQKGDSDELKWGNEIKGLQ